MTRAIPLDDLLTYSSIYGLDLVEQDILHLKGLRGMYADKIDGYYIYKPISKKYDLVLKFNGYHTSGNGQVELQETDANATQYGYPLFVVRSVYFKTIPNLSDIAHITHLQTGSTVDTSAVFATIDEFKNKFLSYEMKQISNYRQIDQGFIEACFWAANKSYVAGTAPSDKQPNYKTLPNYLNYIVSVLQLDNDVRIAFYTKKRTYSGYGSNNYSMSQDFYITRPGDEVYNWTDPNRYFSHLADDIKQPKVVYIEDDISFPKEVEIIDVYRRGKAFVTIDRATLDTITRRWMRKQQELAVEADAVKRLEKKIKDRVADLSNGTSFSYNDMDFTDDSITYERQTIKDKYAKTVMVLNRFVGNYSEDAMNFERVFEEWINVVLEKLDHVKSTKGKIGDVEYELVVNETTFTPKPSAKTKKVRNPVVSRTYYINDNRINKEEITQVLSRAICFPTTADFTAFCESVAACSLKFHKFIAAGLDVKVQDEILNETREFKINLDRRKHRNFINIDGKEWKVLNTNRLLSIIGANSMAKVISVLLDTDTIGMTGAEIKDLLDKGTQRLLEQRTKENELLTQTMDLFKIEKIENATCNNGKTLSGYLVRGKIREYLVEETKCMVYEYPTGRYICMVDKGQNEHTNVARLVNRFYALSNDSKLSQEISTL